MNETEQQNTNAKHKFDVLYKIWLGRRDSNPRMPVPKTGALPLGDAPIYLICGATTVAANDGDNR